jgi:hypothetical protein
MESESAPTRRDVLRLGFFAALSLGVLGLPPLLLSREKDILEAVMGRLYPPLEGEDASLPSRAVEATLAYLAEVPPRQLWQVRGLLRFVEWDPFLRHASRFSRLSTEAQDNWLGRQAQSSLPMRRQVFSALKMLGAMGAWQLDHRWPAIGYPGPMVER